MSDARSGKPRALGRGLDNIVRKDEPSTEDVDATAGLLGKVKRTPVLPPTPSRPSTPSRVSTESTPSIAPSRDFTRTANSIVREAVPSGAFGGKSKQLYDFLYSQTRGAITPRMSVTLSKIKLMAGADIGSEVTLKKNLDRLKAWGFIAERVIAGTHGGNEYTVYLPEETTPSRGSTPSSSTYSLSNLETLEVVDNSPSSPTLNDVVKEHSGELKTKIKTSTLDDDEAMPQLRARIGKAPRTEAVLLALLDTLETRTDVSSPDALLAHVLTKKLAPKPNTARQRPSSEPFEPPPPVEFSEEELAELREIVAGQKAVLELEGN